MKNKLLFLLCLCLTGCATKNETVWFHTTRDFDADRTQCVSSTNNVLAFYDCMKKLGWKNVSGDELKWCEAKGRIINNQKKKLREEYIAKKNLIIGKAPSEVYPLTPELINLIVEYQTNKLDLLEKSHSNVQICFSKSALLDASNLLEKRRKFLVELKTHEKKLIAKQVKVAELEKAFVDGESIKALLK